MPILSRSIVGMLVLTVMAGLVHPAPAAEKPDLPLLFSDNFEDGLDHWAPTDPKAWTITATPRGKVLNQHRLSDYKPPHGSPLNIALLKDIVVGDFVMTVNVKSTTGRKNGHRDMCVFFGYQSPARFYYAHQGLRRDAVSNHILIVNDAKRAPITKKTSPGCNWTDEGWHRIKVVRDVERGTIEVYFDDMETPAKTAVDKTFTWGQVGLGSYDDTGQWDDFKLYGRRVTPPGP
jgi:hypothetical protein